MGEVPSNQNLKTLKMLFKLPQQLPVVLKR